MKDSQKRYYKKNIKNKTIQFNLNNTRDCYILKNLYKINFNKYVKSQLFWLIINMKDLDNIGRTYDYLGNAVEINLLDDGSDLELKEDEKKI